MRHKEDDTKQCEKRTHAISGVLPSQTRPVGSSRMILTRMLPAVANCLVSDPMR
jgi:hypothetical protein